MSVTDMIMMKLPSSQFNGDLKDRRQHPLPWTCQMIEDKGGLTEDSGGHLFRPIVVKGLVGMSVTDMIMMKFPSSQFNGNVKDRRQHPLPWTCQMIEDKGGMTEDSGGHFFRPIVVKGLVGMSVTDIIKIKFPSSQ